MLRKTSDARPIPPWAAGILSRLSRDRPAVVTREQLADYLAELGQVRDLHRTARDLQQLGWLATLHLKGVWAFVPAGESRPTDPYLDLRAWKLSDVGAVFALAGEAAAWHLGYIQRRFAGPPALWLPPTKRVPHGLRSHISLVRIAWAVKDAKALGPSPKLLRKKGLDLTAWASGLPALGPEALLVQLAVRPGSFRVWADLIGQLDVLVDDCEPARLTELLAGQPASAWQRAGYLLDRGGQHDLGLALREHRPTTSMPSVSLGSGPEALWSSDFQVNDRLIAPLQQRLAKA